MASQETANKKLIAGIFGIVLGVYGIHKFYLGYENEGMIMLAVTLASWVACLSSFFCCIGVVGIFGIFGILATAIVGIIEGIIYITKPDDEFEQIYIVNRRPWF